METSISAIDSETVIKIWSKVAPLLEKVTIKDPIITLEELFKRLCIDGTHLLWIVWEKNNTDNIIAVMVTNILGTKESGGPVLLMYCLGGINKEEWLEHLKFIESYALDNGCNEMRVIDGRKGWKKDFKKLHLNIIRYTYSKKIGLKENEN